MQDQINTLGARFDAQEKSAFVPAKQREIRAPLELQTAIEGFTYRDIEIGNFYVQAEMLKIDALAQKDPAAKEALLVEWAKLEANVIRVESDPMSEYAFAVLRDTRDDWISKRPDNPVKQDSRPESSDGSMKVLTQTEFEKQILKDLAGALFTHKVRLDDYYRRSGNDNR